MSFRWMTIVLIFWPQAATTSQDDEASPVTILIAYDSRTGNTETFARAVLEGVGTVEGAIGVLRKQSDVEEADIVDADGILVGSPVHWGNLSVETKGFIDRLGGVLASAGEIGTDSTPATRTLRTGGAFVTGGSVASGKELVRIGILTSLLAFKFVIIGGEDAAGFGTLGAQATTGPSDPGLSEAELAEARRFGARFARLTKKLAP